MDINNENDIFEKLNISEKALDAQEHVKALEDSYSILGYSDQLWIYKKLEKSKVFENERWFRIKLIQIFFGEELSKEYWCANEEDIAAYIALELSRISNSKRLYIEIFSNSEEENYVATCIKVVRKLLRARIVTKHNYHDRINIRSLKTPLNLFSLPFMEY